MYVRIRQVALITGDFYRTAMDVGNVLGVEACYNDPAVAKYGLKNTIWPIGHQFLEAVAPTREETAGGRYLARRGGATGYILCTQTDDLRRVRERVADAGVRIVNDISHTGTGHEGIQLHPADTGGCFWELDHISLKGGDEVGGPWPPAGSNWDSFVNTSRVSSIVGIDLQTDDPSGTAELWSAILSTSTTTDNGAPSVRLDDGAVRFHGNRDGRGPGLAGIDVVATDKAAVMAAAAEHQRGTGSDEVTIGGLRIRLV